MAYADANLTNRKFGTGATVLAIEVGVAWVIIAGLSMTISPKIDPRVNTFTIPPEPTIKPTELPPTPVSQPETNQLRPITDPIGLGPTTLPTFVPDNVLGSGDGGGIELPHATPTPPPAPTFAPKSARPKGKMANWVTTNDYPTAGLRGEHEGSVRYRLSIDGTGKVRDCTVTASSGHAELDEAACATLLRRAQFDPATDETGARAPGSYSGTVTWRLPQD